MNVTFRWRADVDNDALNALHAEGFDHRIFDDDWNARLHRHSLGWVTAHDGDTLVGFVNVAWDGGVHAFVLDTLVARTHRGHGIATKLIERVTDEARRARCEWLHVDFDDELRPFYFVACGFHPTNAGLIAL
jgi:GNAT superfamily N-acetyltransferase